MFLWTNGSQFWKHQPKVSSFKVQKKFVSLPKKSFLAENVHLDSQKSFSGTPAKQPKLFRSMLNNILNFRIFSRKLLKMFLWKSTFRMPFFCENCTYWAKSERHRTLGHPFFLTFSASSFLAISDPLPSENITALLRLLFDIFPPWNTQLSLYFCRLNTCIKSW